MDMVGIWLVYGWYMVGIWSIYGWSMDNLWIIYRYGWWLSPTPLKNMKTRWDDYSIFQNKEISKPSTSICSTRSLGNDLQMIGFSTSMFCIVMFVCRRISHTGFNSDTGSSHKIHCRHVPSCTPPAPAATELRTQNLSCARRLRVS